MEMFDIACPTALFDNVEIAEVGLIIGLIWIFFFIEKSNEMQNSYLSLSFSAAVNLH